MGFFSRRLFACTLWSSALAEDDGAIGASWLRFLVSFCYPLVSSFCLLCLFLFFSPSLFYCFRFLFVGRIFRFFARQVLFDPAEIFLGMPWHLCSLSLPLSLSLSVSFSVSLSLSFLRSGSFFALFPCLSLSLCLFLSVSVSVSAPFSLTPQCLCLRPRTMALSPTPRHPPLHLTQPAGWRAQQPPPQPPPTNIHRPPQPEHPPYHLMHVRGSGFQRFPRYC